MQAGDALSKAVGQESDNLLSNGSYFQKVDDLFHDGPVPDFLLFRPSQVERAGKKILFHQNVPGGHDVVLSAQAGVEFDVLEGSRDPEFG